jgi:DNA invertase Pin-like site-specific DNA recombinase
MEKVAVIYCLSNAEEVHLLKSIATDHGQTAITVLTDNAATAPGQGAGWQALVRMVGKGSVQMVIVPSIIVFGAGLDDLVKLVATMAEQQVGLIAVAEGIDTTQPDGRAWMATIALLQRYQVGVRHRKARAGQLRAKDGGVRFGRPPVPDITMKSVRTALAAGHGIRSTARKMGVSPARVAIEKQAIRAAENS